MICPHLTTPCEALEARLLLARLGLDYAYGDDGLAPVNGSVMVAAMPDGKVLAVSSSSVTRLNADGTVDSSFFDEGGAQAALGKLNWVSSSAVVSGGRMYIAGVPRSRAAQPVIDSNSVFVRALNLADGSKVDSFGDQGFMRTIITSLTPGDTVNVIAPPSIAATADGGFVFTAGQRSRGATGLEHGALTLYKSDARGRLNHSFGGDGEVVVLPSGGGGNGVAVEVDASGRILVFHPDQFTRYLADGSLDEDYGEGGTSPVEIHGFFPQFRRFTLQPDGKAIIPVDTDHDNGPTSELVRENPDGSVETSFGFGFTVNYGLSSPVVDEQGRITFIGDGTIARLTSDFKLDTTFGDAGRVPIPAGFGPGRLTLAPDGSIFIGDEDGVSRYAQTDPVQLTSDGVIHVEGYGGDDAVTAVLDGRFLNVFFNDEVFTYRASRVTAIGVTTRNGNDTVDLAIDRPATISTSYGDDTIRIAGSAAVVIRSGEGIDFVETGDGADTIHAGGAATILSGAGNDFIGSQEPEGYYLNYPEWGTASYLEVDMGAGDDHILSGVAECFVWGGEGNDLIDNRENFRDEALSRLNGEGGDDTIFGGAGADIVTGGPGVDQIDAREGMNRVDGVTIFGPDFQTTFAGYSLDQSGTLTYTGSAANDSAQVYVNEFNGRLIIWRSARATAADRGVIRRIRMIGGDGNDFIGVNVNTDLPASVEGGGGNDEIAGGMLADVLLGGAGNDSIVGNGGNDTVIAGDGDDSLYGGAGNDDLRGDAGNDYFEGGAGGDTLTGGGGADALFGLAGNDSLLSDGDGVKDTVRGGTGTDSADADDLDDVLGVESVS